jgi:hypothetical protein
MPTSSWGHLKVCTPNNANSDKPGTQNSNGLIASAELGFEMFGHGHSGLLLGGEPAGREPAGTADPPPFFGVTARFVQNCTLSRLGQCGPAWENTPSAVTSLTSVAAAMPKNRQRGKTVR